MDFSGALHALAGDNKFAALGVLIALDLVLGVIASVANPAQKFTLSYVANFMRNDVLAKVLPWAALEVTSKVSGGATLVLGIDLSTVADATWAIVILALLGSLTKSLGDLGLPIPPALAGQADVPDTTPPRA